MTTRNNLLTEVLELNSERDRLQEEIDELYEKALSIEDSEDDECGNDSYISCIKSYSSHY